ncbi:MAG: prolipoprotein diacylglyceryl transferase, partial [Patescibacteria group bacterium]|nr:prolipoprotein diacylglyceryl transferase [Patescibacteria group bacterium]
MLNFLHMFEPSPIAFAIGPLGVHWYGLLLGAAVLAGYWLVGKLAPKQGLPKGVALGIFVNALIGGFVGARLYHVVTDWGFYGAHPDQIIAVWNGGLAIHGAMLGSAAVVLYGAKKHHLNIWKLADVFAVAAILGQAIGRWGNYFNQELFGRPTGLPFGIPIDPQNRPERFEAFTHFHPT